DAGGGANTVLLEFERESFRRSFVGQDGNFIKERFEDVFADNRLVRIDIGGRVLFRRVTGRDATATRPTRGFTPALPSGCMSFASALLTPVALIRYRVEPLDTAAFEKVVGTSGTRVGSQNRVGLVRSEIDATNGEVVPDSERLVLDYAVEFQVDA